MRYKKDIIQFVKEVVQGIDWTLTIETITNNGNGTWDLIMCDIGYLEILRDITIGGNTYTITEYISGGIRVSGTVNITVKTFVPYALVFNHGTVLATISERADILLAKEKTPFVFFLEVIEEEFFEDNDNSLERRSPIRLFFLTVADFTNWKTLDYHTYAVQPMRRMMENFLEALKKALRVSEIDSYKVINHNKFGVYANEKGFETAIFPENLSGCELRIGIEIRKKNNCEC